MLIRNVALVLAILALQSPLSADDDVFARQGDVYVTQDEIDAAFARVPEQYRMAVIRDGGKVDEILQSLLRYKQLARAADEAGFSDDPVIQARLKLVAEKELSETWLEHIVANAPEADYEALAYERYIVEKDNFMSEESVDVSHVLVAKNAERDAEAALELANRLRAELLDDPSLFEQYVVEYSDDPAKVQNKGRYAGVKRGQMVKPFEEAAFAMSEAGQISEPVETSFGYHVIRLDRKNPAGPAPFENVKGQLIEAARQERLTAYRKNYILSVSADPIELEDGAVEKMLKRHFGENLELAPDLYKQ